MTTSIIDQGFSLMLYGMGVVFVFLTILIFATTGMSAAIQRWFPHVEEPVARKPAKRPAAGGQVSQQTLKIIQAAIEQHRKSR